MLITKFELKNFMAFQDSGILHFGSGINVVIGRNNVGKSAFLKALSLRIDNQPHKSIMTVPDKNGISRLGRSEMQITLSFDKSVIKKLITQSDGTILIPSAGGHDLEQHKNFIEWLKRDENVEITYMIHQDNFSTKSIMFGLYTPSYDFYTNYKYEGDDVLHNGRVRSTSKEPFENRIFNHIKQRIYRFDAERLIPSSAKLDNTDKLKSDISNLPTVLNVLMSNFYRFKEFNDYLIRVLPDIQGVTTIPIDNSTIEIRIWNVDPVTKRDDLTVPLHKSGTGVGQVLAILYLVFSATEPQIVIIDEPQTFLHPRALRNLMDVLKEFPQHQFVIGTHSPLVISATQPSTVTTINHNGNEASALQIDYKDVYSIKRLLEDIGLRLSDFFGSDNILWVEGPTEELCFPMILEQIVKYPLRGCYEKRKEVK